MTILTEELEIEELRRRAGLPPRTNFIRSLTESETAMIQDKTGHPYTVKHSTGVNDEHIFDAYDGNKKVFHARMSWQGTHVVDLETDPAYQRRGIAKAMYDYIERLLGYKLKPSPVYQTPDGKAFWASRQSTTESADDMIKVGQTMRPRLNSLGQPIHKTDQGIYNFWQWFRDSKVVDAQGRPLVCYHGTSKRFAKFNTKKMLQNIIWFTSDRSRIERGEVGAAGAGVIMPLYVKLDNPANWKQYDALLLAQFKGHGLDGAILPSDGGFDGFVFTSNQVKSADRNKGNFDGTQGKITE